MGLYSLITSFRNWCFDKGILREHRYATPIIGVGNLAVGGTGKTPHVEYIARLLAGRRVAVVSRGYGRKTHGFLRVEQHSTAHAYESGDTADGDIYTSGYHNERHSARKYDQRRIRIKKIEQCLRL